MQLIRSLDGMVSRLRLMQPVEDSRLEGRACSNGCGSVLF